MASADSNKKRKMSPSIFDDTKVTKRFNKAPKYSQYHIKPDEEYIGKFKFRSERDFSKVYEVKILPDASLTCNCGIQFGDRSRGHCKHISSVLKEMLSKYTMSMASRGLDKEVNAMLDSLKI